MVAQEHQPSSRAEELAHRTALRERSSGRATAEKQTRFVLRLSRTPLRESSTGRTTPEKQTRTILNLSKTRKPATISTYKALKTKFVLKKRYSMIAARESPRVQQRCFDAANVAESRTDVCFEPEKLDLKPGNGTKAYLGLGTPPHAEQGNLRAPPSSDPLEWRQRGTGTCSPAVTLKLQRAACVGSMPENHEHDRKHYCCTRQFKLIPQPGEPMPKSGGVGVTAGLISALKRNKRVKKLAYEWRNDFI